MSEVDKNANEKKLDWSKLNDLSDQALAAVVESAIFVLKQSDTPGAPSPTEMPAKPMTKALEQLLGERGADTSAAGRVVKQNELSRPVAVALLSAIATEPVLAQEVERVWRERRGLLVVGTGGILAAALLFLMLKLKKVKATKDGVEVDFDKLSTGALRSVLKFLG
jgi:hypothetical protein